MPKLKVFFHPTVCTPKKTKNTATLKVRNNKLCCQKVFNHAKLEKNLIKFINLVLP